MFKVWCMKMFSIDSLNPWRFKPNQCSIRVPHETSFLMMYALQNSEEKKIYVYCSTTVFMKKTVETTVPGRACTALGLPWFSAFMCTVEKPFTMVSCVRSCLSASSFFHFIPHIAKTLAFWWCAYEPYVSSSNPGWLLFPILIHIIIFHVFNIISFYSC